MFDEIKNAIIEVQQPRSRFQLEKFVIGQHPTEAMQYYQVLLELQDLIYKWESAELALKKTELEIQRLRESGDEIDEITALEKELGAKQTKIAMLGAKREIAHLVDIYNSFSQKFTREEIESNQPQYWEARLKNNASAMLMGGQSVNPAHIESMRHAGILDRFIAEVEIAKKELP
jgi:hypothetical protein